MTSLIPLGIVCCILGVLLGTVALLSARRNPNRIANGFALAGGALLVIGGIAYVAWGLPEQSPAVLFLLTLVYHARNVIFAVLGVALLVNGCVTVRCEGFSLTHALPFGWGVLLLVVSYWFIFGPGLDMTGSQLYVNAMTFLSILMAYIPLALFGAWLSNDICYKSRKQPETRYVVVLGCGIRRDGSVTPLLKGRLDAGLAAWETGGRRAKIIVSGGQGPDEAVSEARAMANYLLSQGVPETDILLEDTSTTTEENLRNSRAIMEARGRLGHCTVATSSYHCLRAALFARRVGLDVSCVGGRTAPFYYPAAFFREYIALIVSNRRMLAAFFVIAVARFVLVLTEIMPEGFI